MIKEIKTIKLSQLTPEEIEKQYNIELFAKKQHLINLQKREDRFYPDAEQAIADMQKVSKEVWVKNKIINAKTLKDLGMSFESASKMLKERNIPVVLTEEDKVITENESDFKEMSDLMFVHKTRYFPENNTIKTAKSAGAYLSYGSNIEVDGQQYTTSGKVGRDTIHFTLNTETKINDGSIMATIMDNKNNWQKMKYTILIPGDNINEEQLIALRTEDSYFKGNLQLPAGTTILVPENEQEILQQNNPEVQIIGYVGDPEDYGTALLSAMGYKAERIDPNTKRCWSNHDDTNKIYELANKKEKSILEHWASKEINEEDREHCINCLVGIFKNIIEKKIKEDSNFITNIYNEKELLSRIETLFYQIIIGKESFYNQNALETEGIDELLDAFAKNGISIGEERNQMMRETFTRAQYQKNFSNWFVGQLLMIAVEQNTFQESKAQTSTKNEPENDLYVHNLIEQLREKINQINNSDSYIEWKSTQEYTNFPSDLFEKFNTLINEGYYLKSIATNDYDIKIISSIICCLEESIEKTKITQIVSENKTK